MCLFPPILLSGVFKVNTTCLQEMIGDDLSGCFAGSEAGSVPIPKETEIKGISTTPPRILHVFPSQSVSPIPIQFITIPDTSRYQVVQLSSSPPLLGLPIPNTATTPTYIIGEFIHKGNPGRPK